MSEKKKPDLKVDMEEPEIRVEDRRYWARSDRGEGDEAGRPDASRPPSYVAELQAKLEAAEKRQDDVLAAHRRMQAEFDEFRERLNRDFDVRVQQGKAAVFRRFLEVADHMELALEAAEKRGDAVAEGVRLIRDQLLDALRDEGVERMDLVGEPYDPELAEAVAVVPVDDPARHDRVVAEVRPGYRLGEWTLRAAQVQVGRHQGPAQAGADRAGSRDAGADQAGAAEAGTEQAGAGEPGTEGAGADEAGVEEAGTRESGAGGEPSAPGERERDG